MTIELPPLIPDCLCIHVGTRRKRLPKLGYLPDLSQRISLQSHRFLRRSKGIFKAVGVGNVVDDDDYCRRTSSMSGLSND